MKIKGLVDYSQPIVAAATVLSVGMVIAVGLASYSAYKVKMAANTIEMTGSAKETVMADFARWTIMLNAKTPIDNQQFGFDILEKATDKITAYLQGQGFNDMETPAPTIWPEYVYPEKSAPLLTGYSVSRQIIVRSSDIDAIQKLTGNISPLSGPSYNVSTGNLELTYQDLPQMRIKLLSEAIKDARARAEAIAKETGRKVGTLKSAVGGVVQVLPQGGIDISDYGSYDTQSKNKDIMVTVRASFIIK